MNPGDKFTISQEWVSTSPLKRRQLCLVGQMEATTLLFQNLTFSAHVNQIYEILVQWISIHQLSMILVTGVFCKNMHTFR